jgi:branched-chain amino acid transport system ATP-binding protein
LLSLEAVDAGYGDLQALFGVSFEVRAQEIVALVGANAAGKTTTLRVISGLLAPRRGRVLYDGDDLGRLPAHRRVDRGIVQVPEGRRLFPFMTVMENLLLGAHSPAARAECRRSLDDVFALFPMLAERHRQLAGSLSGGEQQMCAIGRALMAKPRLLMLDEPTLGLAPVLVGRIFETVRAINAAGVTVLLVEQNVRQALTLAHRACVLESGRLVLAGRGRDLLGDERLTRAYLGMPAADPPDPSPCPPNQTFAP